MQNAEALFTLALGLNEPWSINNIRPLQTVAMSLLVFEL